MEQFYTWMKGILAVLALLVAGNASAQDNFSYTISPTNVNPFPQLAGVVSINIGSSENIFMSRRKIYLYDGQDNPITNEDGAQQSYTLSMGDKPNILKFNIAEPITAEGLYTFVIPAGSLEDDDTGDQIPEIRFTYSVVPNAVVKGNWSVSPSLDEPIETFTGDYVVTLHDYAETGVSWYSPRPCIVLIYRKGDDLTGRPLTWFSAEPIGNEIHFTAWPPITQAGEYILNIADFVVIDTKEGTYEDIPDTYIPFTLTGGEEVIIPEDPKTPLDQTFTLSPDNSHSLDALSGTIVITFPNIPAFGDIGGFVTITSTTGINLSPENGDYIRIRQFDSYDGSAYTKNAGYINLDAYGLKFTEDGEYTFSIPKYTFHVDNEDLETKFDKDYVDPFSFTYVIGTGTSIATLVAPVDGSYNATTMNGATVLRAAKAAELQSLKPGLYIVNGKKCILK